MQINLFSKEILHSLSIKNDFDRAAKHHHLKILRKLNRFCKRYSKISSNCCKSLKYYKIINYFIIIDIFSESYTKITHS